MYTIDDLKEKLEDLENELNDIKEGLENQGLEGVELLEALEDNSECRNYNELQDIIEELEQYGAKILIEKDEFEDYCREELEDCGYIPSDFPRWIEIDWESTANNMAQDYSEIEYSGETYLYR